ncbi:uncharacterized protein LOC113782266 [Coffea eugenioides]|uniref:uncharacterized protein LOC113782266 n=1 Tax=Coffea eugenioides TaxID=49369 RepID=UPI000F607545|nr:uncharacterized protein LOC113782266 [Coffea eugenioides]
MRAFPFSLKDFAKDWLYYLLPSSITTWDQLKKKFLDKYFQSLYDYWERFKKLCIKYPQHQISEQLLIQYFYEGLIFRDRSIIDAANEGALVNKTPWAAWELIKGMTENSQQFGTREDVLIRKVNEVKTSSIQQQLTELTSFVRQLAVGNASQAKVCGIYTIMDHSTDMCPIIQEQSAEQVNMASHAPVPRMPYDPYSNTYNPGPELTIPKDKDEERIENELEKEDSNGTNQKVLPDPVITVRTNPSPFPSRLEKPRKQDKEQDHAPVPRMPYDPYSNTYNPGPELTIPKDKDEERIENELEKEDSNGTNQKVLPDPVITVRTNPSPFPSRLEKPRKQDKEQEFLGCSLRGDERVIVGENVLAVLQRKFPQRKFPPKYGDPGRFTVPCRIGNTLIRNTLMDLGASINVMLKCMYAFLNLGPLKEIEIIIQLADRTNAYPDGYLSDMMRPRQVVWRAHDQKDSGPHDAPESSRMESSSPKGF